MGKNLLINLFLVLLIFAIQAFVTPAFTYAQNRPAAIPRLEPDPKALEYHNIVSRNPNLSWTQLAEISLWASGDINLSTYQRLHNAVTAMNNSSELPASGRERAEFILEYMHSNILRTYSLYQTRVDTIFTNGRFNCVSSSVLYMILCKSAGINTSGVVTKEHAFVIAHINGQNIDVETTNRYGFEPGSRREFHDEFGRLTGFSYVPAQNYRDRQTINQIELISLIFNNRIAETERANRYAESVPFAIDRTALLLGNLFIQNHPESAGTIFENPIKELMDRLINYGAYLLRINREEDALNWAAAASVRYTDPVRWQELIMAAANNRIARFIRDRRPAEARNFLRNNAALLSQENYFQLDSIVIDAELNSRANNLRSASEGEAIIADIEQARLSGKMTERRASELLTFTIQKTAAALCAPPGRDWRAAINFLEAAISRFGPNRDLEQNLRTYRDNLVSDYHNRFAAEWNRRNYDAAVRILDEALAEFPDNRQLLANREIVNRHGR